MVARVRDVEVGAFRLVADTQRLKGARSQFLGDDERRQKGDAKTSKHRITNMPVVDP